MPHSTTDPVTGNDTNITFEPYLPPCGRVLQVLRASASADEALTIANRDLAAAAQCSAGSIPAILRRLEADGWIERITSARGSLIVVIDQHADRSARRVASDQYADRSAQADSAAAGDPREKPPEKAISMLIADQGESASDQHADPPHTPHMVLDHDSMQQQQACAVAENPVELLRSLGLWGSRIVDAVADYGYTTAQIDAMWAAAQSRADIADPRRLLFRCLVANEPIYAAADLAQRQQEAHHAHPQRPNAPHQRKRSRARTRALEPQPAVDYDAFLAEVQALNPGMRL